MAVPMCPGCRALLGPDEPACPYCGRDLRVEALRRHGGLVDRALRPLGGVVPALLFANGLLAVLAALVQVRLVPRLFEDAPPASELAVDGILSPHGEVIHRMGSLGIDAVHPPLGEPLRLLSCVFLHFGILHLGVNMMSLWNIGPLVVEAFGSGKALALYILGGVAASGATAGLWALQEHGPRDGMNLAGASGAICAYAGLVAALGFRIGGPEGRHLWTSMVKAVGFILVLGIVLQFSNAGFRLGNAAHAGGFLFGLGAGFVCSFGARARIYPWRVKAWDAVALALVLLTVASFAGPAIALARTLR